MVSRYPLGAIREGEEITLKVNIKRNFMCKPIIIIEKRHDNEKQKIKEIPMEWVFAEKDYDIYSGFFSLEEKGHYFYYIELENNKNAKYNEENKENTLGESRELIIYDKEYQTPNWIKGGIIYHIFVDRFNKTKTLSKDDDIILRKNWGALPYYLPDEKGEIKNNDFFGGNLNGIEEKLPYLKNLGITAIYLSPIFEAHSNHKYDTGDYFKIDPLFGTEKDFKHLINKAKELGISIILDGVFSHTGDDSIYFNKYGRYNSLGAYESKDSPYIDWYIFNNWKDDYSCWWGIKTLPNINKESVGYKEFIMGSSGVLKHYLREGVMGYRLDVADELPNDFLIELRNSIKSEEPDALIIGEVWEDAANKFSYDKLKEYLCGKQLDSVTNYPLRTAIIKYLIEKDCSLLYETMNFIIEKYPAHSVHCLMNILGTHDTARILTELGCNDKPNTKEEKAKYKLSKNEISQGIKLLKLASLLQMTLPGVPCIYYGDEAGMEGWEDPFNRVCFPWGSENKELISHYKFLNSLRKSSSLFIDGMYKCLVHDDGVFVFERYNENNRIVIGINLSNCTVNLNFHETMSEYNTKNTGSHFKIMSEDFLILINMYHPE